MVVAFIEITEKYQEKIKFRQEKFIVHKKGGNKSFLYFFDSRKNLLQLSEHVSLVTVLEQPRGRERKIFASPLLFYSWRKKDANIFLLVIER